MPAGGTLKMLARMDGAHAVVNFMDTGSTEEPQLGRCFTSAFARDLPPDNHDHSDSIARVALCERIVGEHCGRIYAAPSPLGSLGITLRLPLC
jgi:two-component system sensor histidine kinase BaeS